MSDESQKPMGGIGRSLMENIPDRVGPQIPVSIKDHIRGDVEFLHYRDGNLWYECLNTGFQFPVPTSDTGTATFLGRDKASLFMRWIKKHMELKP